MKQLVIYRIYHKESGKSYIGKCTHGDARIKSHFALYKNSKCEYRAKLLYRAMKKYGPDAFAHEILCEVDTIEQLNQKEIRFIDGFDSRTPEKGYNIKRGGDGGDTWSGLSKEERAARIKKQSEAQKKAFTEEHRAISSETLKAIRANREKSKKNAEVCSQRLKQFNKTNPPRRRPVYCVETGETFDSVKQLSIKVEKVYGYVLQCIDKPTRRISKLHYKYVNVAE